MPLSYINIHSLHDSDGRNYFKTKEEEMKKILVIMLLMAVALLTFADDALVLPKGVLRTYITCAYGFATSAYDADGEKQDMSSGLYTGYKIFNLGGAVEYGVTDWMSAAVQWAPGWNVWSQFDDPAALLDDNSRLNGPFDVFAGAKIQVVGENGLVANEKFRIAFAPGVKVPLPDPDWQKQADNQSAGDPWNVRNVDKHALGIGARAYADYVINKMLYVNLYSEFIYYLKKDRDNTDLWPAGPLSVDAEVEYGYDLTLEAEPHFEMMFGDGLRLGIGVPATVSMNPAEKRDGVEVADSEGYLFSVSPSVSLFLMKFFIPTELKVGYTLPLLGKNSDAVNRVVFQLKTYMKF
jgi:hypothetical protein